MKKSIPGGKSKKIYVPMKVSNLSKKRKEKQET